MLLGMSSLLVLDHQDRTAGGLEPHAKHVISADRPDISKSSAAVMRMPTGATAHEKKRL